MYMCVRWAMQRVAAYTLFERFPGPPTLSLDGGVQLCCDVGRFGFDLREAGHVERSPVVALTQSQNFRYCAQAVRFTIGVPFVGVSPSLGPQAFLRGGARIPHALILLNVEASSSS